jgi:hypothetical protein
MLLVQLCIYLCVYLSQAMPLLSSLGTKWDLFRHTHPVQEVQLESTVPSCSVAVPLVPAVPLQSGQVCRGETGPFLGLIARDRRLFRSELDLGCRNPADQVVSSYYLYL